MACLQNFTLEEDLNLKLSNCKVCQLKHGGLMYSCKAFSVGGVEKCSL